VDRRQQIQTLYRKILGREADEGGLNSYEKSNLSLYDIQIALWNSDEFKEKHSVGFPKDDSKVDSSIKIFVVNLKRRPDRRDIIEKRLNDLALTNYEIIEAVDGKELPEDVSHIYDEAAATKIHRNLQRSEIGCALSHINIAKKVIEQNLEYAIILEDDAEPTLKFKEFIKNFKLEPNRFDFLMFGCFSSNEWFNGKIKIKTSPYILAEKRSIVYLDEVEFSIGDVSIHRPHYPTQELDFVNATHAYMISNRGARFLLEHNYPVRLEADNVWNYYHDECELMFTNPILVHAKWEDSDIRDERKYHQHNFDHYSDGFKSRVNHLDFGT
jgi:glycosyl transferase family 25